MKKNIFKLVLVLSSMIFATAAYAGEIPVKNAHHSVKAKKSRAPASAESVEYVYTVQPVVCNTSEQESLCFGRGTDGKVTGNLVCAKVNNACPKATECGNDPTDAGVAIQALAAYGGPNDAACDAYKQQAEPPAVRGGGGGR